MTTIARMDVRLGMNASDFDKEVKRTQGTLEGMSKKLNSIGSAMSLGVTAPIVGVALAAAKSAGDFEQSMNIMGQVSGATAQQMKELQAQALELGATTSFSAGEAAEAQLELAKAGLSVADTMAALPGVLDLAAAGGVELGTAANLTASALNAFGLEATESTRVANMLAAAANASASDIGDLGAGLQQGGFAFSAAGQSIEDLTASIAILSNVGLTGSDAGTALKNAVIKLINPTAEAADLMAELGINVYDAQGEMLPWADVIDTVNVATADMTDQQRNAALSTIFMSDGMKAMIPLLDQGKTGFLEMKDTIGQAGAASETAGARMKGINGAIEYLKGSIDSFLISTALPYLATMSGIIRQGADLITAFTTMPVPVQETALAFGGLLAAIGPIALALSGLIAVVGFLLSPVGLLAIAVVALGAAWYTNFGGIQEITASAWATISPLLNEALVWLQTTIPTALAYLQSMWATTWPAIQATFSTAWLMIQAGLLVMQTWLSTAIPSALSSLTTLWETAWAALPGAVTTAQTTIATAWTAIQAGWNTLVELLTPSIERLRIAFSFLPLSISALQPSIENLLIAFQTFWAALQPILQGLGTLVAGIFAVIAVVAVNTFVEAIERIAPVAQAMIDQLTTTLNYIASLFRNAVTLFTAVVNGDWSTANEAIKNIAKVTQTFLGNTFRNMKAVVTNIIHGLADIVTNTLEDMGVDVKAAVDGIAAWWESTWQMLADSVQPLIDAVDAVKKAISDFQSWLGSIHIAPPWENWSAPAMPDVGGALGDMAGNAGAFFTGQRASGGPVMPGGLYKVNEVGDEMFVPSQSGRIIPSSELGNWADEMSGSGAAAGTLTIAQMNVYNEVDIQAIAQQVAMLLNRRR